MTCLGPQKPTPEELFRSLSLVLADNAETEYAFVATFFGQHSTLDVTKSPHSRSLFTSGTPSVLSDTPHDAESVLGSDAGNSSFDGGLSRDERQAKLRRAVVDNLWKAVFEPALEYARNFTGALLEPVGPSVVSLLAMIRLNEALLGEVGEEEGGCPPLEGHFGAVRMELYAAEARAMTAQVESVRKINGSLPTGGVFGGKNSGVNVKDSVVQVVVLRYAQLFNAFVEMSDDEKEEDNVFQG